MYNLDGPPEARLFGGIPLAKEGLWMLKGDEVALRASVKTTLNSVLGDSVWDEGYGRLPTENVSVTLSQNRTAASY
jgi:hypothetical protein